MLRIRHPGPRRWALPAIWVGLVALGLAGLQSWIGWGGGGLGLALSPYLAPVSGWTQRLGGSWLAGWVAPDLAEENEKLRDRVQQLEAGQLQNALAAQENARLSELLELRQSRFKESLAARVAARDPTGWFAQAALDKGRQDGVLVDMVAVSGQGLVGRVEAVDERASRVRFVLDPGSAVPVVLASSQAVGICYGEGGYRLNVQFIDHRVSVKAGEQVLTSGLGQVYPRGLLVGRVIRNYGRTEALFQSVEVQPAVDFGQLHEMLLLQREQP